MAIKKITIRYKTAIRTLLTIKRNFGKFFLWNGCCWFVFLIRFMGTFGSMPSFEDLENQTLTLPEIISADGVVLGKYFEKQVSITLC
jgi:hypothetical protein